MTNRRMTRSKSQSKRLWVTLKNPQKCFDSLGGLKQSVWTMTLTERYRNDNKVRNYIRIHDSGHNWLEVPAKDVRDAAKVWDNITECSLL
jgi:hypothetical protein